MTERDMENSTHFLHECFSTNTQAAETGCFVLFYTYNDSVERDVILKRGTGSALLQLAGEERRGREQIQER